MRLEYIWLDGNKTPQLRSKTRFSTSIDDWNFDGGSTNQGTLTDSDRVLKPVATYKDPFYEEGLLVLCEVFTYDNKPHHTNHRSLMPNASEVAAWGCWFGFEQEFTLLEADTDEPLGLILNPVEQGQYYCGIGCENIVGRRVLDRFEECCRKAGIELAGINAEVMPGQWEFQTAPQHPEKAADDLWIARYILSRISEEEYVKVSYHPKPDPEFNGAGCHSNFSTAKMREGISQGVLEDLMSVLEQDHAKIIKCCGEGYTERLSGKCETSSWEKFSWGVGDRGASIRIPSRVWKESKGYIEDRRPCANIDPYQYICAFLRSVRQSQAL